MAFTPSSAIDALLGLANPSAVSFLHVNASNVPTFMSAANFRTALGVGTGDSPVFTSLTSGAGSSGTPGFNFSTDTATGFYNSGGNIWLKSGSGSSIGIFHGLLTFGTGGDLFLTRDAANTLAQRNGTNAQSLLLYNTYTDASNYERGGPRWGGNVLELGTQAAGTGALRDVSIKAAGTNLDLGSNGGARWRISSTHFLAVVDNTYDIGASGANRPRNIYAAGNDSSFPRLTITSDDLRMPASGVVDFSARLKISAPSNGVALIKNNAGTDFDRLQFGGTTSSFPALKRSTTTLQARLADDSAFTGISASSLLAFNTTDETNYERGTFGFASNILRIGTENAGTGAARAIDFVVGGTVWANLGTGGQASFYGAITSGKSGASGSIAVTNSGGSSVLQLSGNGYGYHMASGQLVTWGSNATLNGSLDTGLARNAAGVVEINNGTAGAFRDLRARSVIQQPPASVTPASNGDFVVEATSNTTLTFKLKGTDGTVRTGTITLA